MDRVTDGKRQYGMTERELAERPTVFREGLLAGRAIMISGAGRGIGKAIATLCARLGADVAICGRHEERLAGSAEFLRGFGGRVFPRALTIRDPEAVSRFVDDAWSELGRLDGQVNNAGGQFAQAAIDFSTKGWLAVMDTNLNGSWWMMQNAAKRWVARGTPGAIVNITAVVWRGMPGLAHMAACRAGVTFLSKSVAVEWAPHRIRVNCVAPGCIESEGFSNYSPEGAATLSQGNPFKQPGDPWDIAESVVYLLAESGKFVTGEVVQVDGGQQLWGDPWPAGRPEYFRLETPAPAA
jgi:NAD(P)-dependent dehydrogenase (short-subunit alcohol dehydrogenase family)